MSSSKPYKLDQVGIRMVKEPPLYSAKPVNSPQAAVRLMSQTLKEYDREVLAVVNLRNRPVPLVKTFFWTDWIPFCRGETSLFDQWSWMTDREVLPLTDVDPEG